MSSHRMNCRRSGIRPEPAQTPAEPDPAARGVSVEETFISDVDELPRPAGFGTEASTSDQTSVLVDEYVVPAQSIAEITDISVAISGNGQATIAAPGVSYGPFTGGVDISVPLEGSKLSPGDRVRVFHQSTDGNSTTTRALLAALEV